MSVKEIYPPLEELSRAQGLGSNSREGMDVCKCLVHLLHGDILNTLQAASPLLRFGGGEDRGRNLICFLLVILYSSGNRGRSNLVVKVTDSWPTRHEFEPCIAEDPPCRGAMHVESVKRSNVLSLVWWLGEGSASSGVVLVF
ncbi:hypothetical protein TNCV_4916161 [Trichonephila clavipes]|nr:hypothetical protein TNCV_4916161 [Trichonephila clavipes]